MENKTIPLPPILKNQEDSIELRGPMPSAVEMEEAVIGALLIDRTALEVVEGFLLPDVFSVEANMIIYAAMLRLHSSNEGVDLLTVSNELRKAGTLDVVGGDYYLVNLMNKISSSAHIEVHARIIIQKYIARELITHSRKIMTECFNRDPDVFMLLEDVEENVKRIHDVAIRKEDTGVTNALEELKQKINKVRAGEPPGIYINVSEFDQWSGGFQDRELITIAGRPGMGKTAIVISITKHLSIDKQIPTAVFSLEMAKTDLYNRYAANLTDIPYEKIRKGILTDQELDKMEACYKYLDESNLEVIDTQVCKNNLDRIIRSIRKLVRDKGTRIVFIDYVQLIRLTRSKGDATGDLNDITGRLKELANELSIPIVILAQLNREVDKRKGWVPILADLKQSGSIEQDSDTVIFIVREAAYQEDKTVVPPPHIAGDTKWIVAKGRSTGVRDFRAFLDFINYKFMSYCDSGF